MQKFENFNLGELVLNIRTNKLVLIEDFEFIDNSFVYYSKKNCYPHNILQRIIKTKVNDTENLLILLKQKLPILSEPLIKESAKRTAEGFKKLTEHKKLEELQEKLLKKQIKKEKWNKVFNKLKKIFLLK